MGGRKLYQFLSPNSGLPSEHSVYKYVQKKEDFEEGKLRIKEFSDFLYERGLKRTVWLSEDATKIVEKV